MSETLPKSEAFSAPGPAAVFRAFLALGLTAFGGPIAHLGYFRTAFVTRRGWLSEADYSDLVALCQFLPGPTSSQVGFAIGIRQAGLWGGIAAFAGFTLPSALALYLFFLASTTLQGPVFTGLLHGLKLVAVAVVAHAVIGMARTLTPELKSRLVALAAVVVVFLLPGTAGQVLAIALGAVAGALLLQVGVPFAGKVEPWRGHRVAIAGLAGAIVLLFAIPALAALGGWPLLRLADIFYRAGALVFGGGHVVLPLLQADLVPQWLTSEEFLAGYGAAQAVPGPLFTVAAYLGAATGQGVPGALVALGFMFLPGLMLVAAAMPLWSGLRSWPPARRALAGINAAVVGVLAAALYDPLITTGIADWLDGLLALAGLALLLSNRVPVLVVIALLAAAGLARVLLGV